MATKTTKKTAAKKPAVKVAPVMEHKCECGKDCSCKCHGKYHVIKKIIVLAIVFSLGMVVGTTLCSGPKHYKRTPVKHPVFVDGCLKTDSVINPMMKKALVDADVNADDCISKEEYKAAKQSMKSLPNKDMQKAPHMGSKGPKGPKGPKAPEAPKAPQAK